jgi:hypothetical protein
MLAARVPLIGRRKLSGAKSLSEFVELSTAQARKQFDIVSAQNKELWTLAQKVATEAAKPIETGMSKAFNNAAGRTQFEDRN